MNIDGIKAGKIEFVVLQDFNTAQLGNLKLTVFGGGYYVEYSDIPENTTVPEFQKLREYMNKKGAMGLVITALKNE